MASRRNIRYILSKRSFTIIHAYHATFGTYGTWLPNDPRGSASRFVGSSRLHQHGGRSDSIKRAKYKQLSAPDQRRIALLQSQLNREAVVLTETQMAEAGIAIGKFVHDHRLQVWAAAILPCHVHLVFARCGRKAELVIDELKDTCNRQLVELGLSPQGCSIEKGIWATGRWIVYLDKDASIESAIAYVLQNPVEEGRESQCWPFVTSFSGIESNIVSYRD